MSPEARSGLDSRTIIARFTARRAMRSGALWGAIFATSIASTAAGYNASFPTDHSRAKLAQSFANNRGISALLGPAHDITNVAGFTAWRISVVLSVLGGVWGLLTGTRLIRGEEDAGRWELLVSGQTTRAGAAAQAGAGLAAGWITMWAIASVAAVAIGRLDDVGFSATSAVFLATAVCACAAVFLAVGAVMSQLAPTRRRANMFGAGVLGAAYLLRMAADSAGGLRWMRWLSPVGWAEELRPLTGSRPSVLLLIGLTVAALAVTSIRLAGARDLGASALPSSDTRSPRTTLLTGVTGLSARLAFPQLLGWVMALCVAGLVFGLVAQSGADALSGSETIADAIARLGGQFGGAEAYLGLTFLIASVLVTVAAAGLITATRNEESDGHVDNLLARPVSRSGWFVGRLGVAAVIVVLAGVGAGVAAWAGAASQGTSVDFSTLVQAGVNVAPPALFVLGLGAMVLGLRPRWTASVVYTVVGWSFLVELLGTVITTNELVLDTSVLHHSAPAPAAPVDWSSAGALVAWGLAAAAIGVAAFRRRDLAGA